MSRRTFDKLATAELGLPFKKVTTREGTVYNEDGDYRHDGKIHIYMDPRGDVEFAIGIHRWMFNVLDIRGKWEKNQNKHPIKVDKAGNCYVLGPTAKEVQEVYARVQRAWETRRKGMDGQEYIMLMFSSTAPLFDADGKEVATDNLVLSRKNREYGESCDLRLNYWRGVLVQENGEDKFYEVEENGRLAPVHIYRDQDKPIYLAYSEETMEKVNAIRRMLARAADMMSDLFSQTPDEFLKRLGNGLPALSAPPPTEDLQSNAKLIRRKPTTRQ